MKIIACIAFGLLVLSAKAQKASPEISEKNTNDAGFLTKGTNVRIKCRLSVSNKESPLFVVDEFIWDAKEFAKLDPRQIERIEVLKDSKAISIYGSGASKGVIVVTTKKMGGCTLLIRDESDGLPVSRATVKVKGIKDSDLFSCDSNGVMRLPGVLKKQKYIFEVSSVGYATTIKEIEFDSGKQEKAIYLQKAFKKLEEVVIMDHGRWRRCGGCGVRVSWIHSHELPKKILRQFSISVFPNPVPANQFLSIVSSQKLTGTFQIFSSAGQLMVAEKSVLNPHQPFRVEANNWSAGTYFLSLTDEISGNQIKEKFIIH